MESFFEFDCPSCGSLLRYSNGDPINDPYGFDVERVKCYNCKTVLECPEGSFDEWSASPNQEDFDVEAERPTSFDEKRILEYISKNPTILNKILKELEIID